MALEAIEQVADMLALAPYPGHAGRHVSLPPRNVVPKAVQKPHPPLWLACSNRNTIRLAARLGMGALTFDDAIHSGGVRLDGPRDLVHGFPTWFLLSRFAGVDRPVPGRTPR